MSHKPPARKTHASRPSHHWVVSEEGKILVSLSHAAHTLTMLGHKDIATRLTGVASLLAETVDHVCNDRYPPTAPKRLSHTA